VHALLHCRFTNSNTTFTSSWITVKLLSSTIQGRDHWRCAYGDRRSTTAPVRVHERHNKVGAVCCLLVCRGFLTGSAAGAASIAGTVPAAASLKRFRGCRGPTCGLELCWCALCPALQTQAGLRGPRDAWGAMAARASPALGPRCCTPSLHPANQPPRAAYQTPLTLPPLSLSLSLLPPHSFSLLVSEYSIETPDGNEP